MQAVKMSQISRIDAHKKPNEQTKPKEARPTKTKMGQIELAGERAEHLLTGGRLSSRRELTQYPAQWRLLSVRRLANEPLGPAAKRYPRPPINNQKPSMF
jgi:hypothetical protein